MEDESLPNILAVDDDFAVRMAMDFMFKKWSEYNLVLAEDPSDALVKLEEREYMMMFSDINMPVMSGLDLLKIVKEKKPDLPVIMLTSETDIQNSITAFRYGAMDYLLKPPTVATVRGAIDKAVEFLEEEAKKAELAEDKLKIALKQEIGEGLVNVDREDDKVIITVGSAGAFKSGSAELTNKAREIMSKIAEQNKKGRSEILVMGHTDNVPLTFGSNYRDNWDLAAARSASVVQQLSRNDTLDPKRMKAISYGETRPVESNDTSQGRAKNRRIEIEINY